MMAVYGIPVSLKKCRVAHSWNLGAIFYMHTRMTCACHTITPRPHPPKYVFSAWYNISAFIISCETFLEFCGVREEC